MNYTDLLGTKFTTHGRSKEEGFDCYGLAIEVLKRNNIYLPDVFYESFDEKESVREKIYAITEYAKIEKPEINCIIELEVMGEPCHVGVYIGSGLFIHTTKKTNVIIESLARYKHRVMGYYRVSKN